MDMPPSLYFRKLFYAWPMQSSCHLTGIVYVVYYSQDRKNKEKNIMNILVSILTFCAFLGFASWSLNAIVAKDNPFPPLTLSVISLLLFLTFQIFFIVPINTQVLVVNQLTGEMVGDVRSPGINTRPLFISRRYSYPGNQAWQWCPQMTPSTRNGIEVEMQICWTIPAHQVDWEAQFRRYNGDAATVTAAWQNEIQSLVAEAVAVYDLTALTNERSAVTSSILENTESWFREANIPITNISIRNWDFTNPEIASRFSEAQLAATQINIAEAKQLAAEVAAETANIHRLACENAGMYDPDLCVSYLQLQWLQSFSDTNPPTIVVGFGSQPSVTVP